MSSQQAKQDQQAETNEKANQKQQNTWSQPNQSSMKQKQEQEKGIQDHQQSFDSYLELKYVESNQQNEEGSSNLKTKNSLNFKINPLVSIDDDLQFPLLHLQPSPKSHKPIEIKIISYRTSTFLGMSTQIFAMKIQDRNVQPPKEYEIERRFSDFADLYEQLFYNHPGYILYPFPDKTLQTFIKIKLGIVVGSNEKLELVEKRLSQIQAFVNSVSQHKQLSNSEELQIFLSQDEKVFLQGKIRANKFVDEYKNLSTKSQLHNIVDLGKSMLSSYFHNGSSQQQPINFYGTENKLMSQASLFVKEEKQKLSRKISQVHLLLQAEKQFSKFIQINTDADILLNFVTKHNSNRKFSQDFANYLEASLENQLNILYRRLEEVEKIFMHYSNIVEEIFNAKSILDLQKKAKLERMLERAQKNFKVDWVPFLQNHKETVQLLGQKFVEKWREHKENARKIWKTH